MPSKSWMMRGVIAKDIIKLDASYPFVIRETEYFKVSTSYCTFDEYKRQPIFSRVLKDDRIAFDKYNLFVYTIGLSNQSSNALLKSVNLKCHFPLIGWAEFARLIQPLIERDFYGREVTSSITAPNLKQAYFTSKAKDEISLEFDQPVVWNDSLISEFYLDGIKEKVTRGLNVSLQQE